ncbi:hypothetical protein CYLTODRAFT_480009 [Cylindrobasidium torrendii FP15055 ss-10]|uniref:Uncharacterized protein n=1 Tax=Cylindrobasidium torrendii FP15055 ss-10 TaxID=1314674 RepID=A0A0D7BFV9_9AGAR|nr:hypothetical protein CYLTODRAFT_480009 [Cylindrobasidium torrendii FP15055 ss-10]
MSSLSSTSKDQTNDLVAASSNPPPLEHSPSVEDRTNCGTVKSSEASIINDDDDFTISGYGEISLSEDCYIPSLPAPCSPIIDESFRRPRRPNGKKEHALLSRPRAPALKSKIFVSDGNISEVE